MKFFKFSETISGGTHYLDFIFNTLVDPFFSNTNFFLTSYFMSLGDFDLADPSAENQAEIQLFAEELGAKLVKIRILFKWHSICSDHRMDCCIICIVPVMFTLATYYKRIVAVFEDQVRIFFTFLLPMKLFQILFFWILGLDQQFFLWSPNNINLFNFC